MSIENASRRFLRSVRTLINSTGTARWNIKVLTDLRILFCPACYRHAGPYGPEGDNCASRGSPFVRNPTMLLASLIKYRKLLLDKFVSSTFYSGEF